MSIFIVCLKYILKRTQISAQLDSSTIEKSYVHVGDLCSSRIGCIAYSLLFVRRVQWMTDEWKNEKKKKRKRTETSITFLFLDRIICYTRIIIRFRATAHSWSVTSSTHSFCAYFVNCCSSNVYKHIFFFFFLFMYFDARINQFNDGIDVFPQRIFLKKFICEKKKYNKMNKNSQQKTIRTRAAILSCININHWNTPRNTLRNIKISRISVSFYHEPS